MSRRVGLRLTCLICVSTTAAVRAQEGPANLDFEEGQVGQTPPGWFCPTKGYTAVLTTDDPHSGRQCVRLKAIADAERAPFGNVMQTFNASDYRLKRICVRAAVRVDAPGAADHARLWVREDRAGGVMGFFDNMPDRPIRQVEWDTYEIVGNLSADAEVLNVGLMIIGEATAWLDDVSIEIVGALKTAENEPPRPLEQRGLENLVAFTRLLGYVRHFHPSDEAAATDWDDFAIRGVREVESANVPDELAATLRALFKPIAPSVLVFPSEQRPDVDSEAVPQARRLRVVMWDHRGLGRTDKGPPSVYRSERKRKSARRGRIPEGFHDPRQPYFAELGGGVACLVPLAVFADGNKTLPAGTAERGEEESELHAELTAADRGTRLAAVALCWNVLQHFYPYFDVVDTDWPAVLGEALTSAATDPDEKAFLKTLRRMIAELHDGHARVHHGCDTARFTLPLEWDWIEGQLVVTFVKSAAEGEDIDLHAGEVIVKIDGSVAAEALAEVEGLISGATPQWRRCRALGRLSAGQEGGEVLLEVEGQAGASREVTLRRTVQVGELQEPRPAKIAELRPGIIYVDLDRITDDDFREALGRLERAKGIVFDFRAYPSGIAPQTLFGHVIDTPVTSPQWHIPLVKHPDRVDLQTEREGEWRLVPKKPYLKAPKAFIIDGRAISYAESCLGIIEHYKLGELVGGPTAGTNGNVNTIDLPGGYHVSWTGMKVLKHDGSQHHGIGILPTVPVARTLNGVRAGRDELLEAAVEVVSK